MGGPGGTRIQLCGRLAVELEGRRVEEALPGAKGRLLFAYLVLNRDRRVSRDELLTAVYGRRHHRISIRA
jgi:SARP family transcriptional regulator, regulator of embCAB operon